MNGSVKIPNVDSWQPTNEEKIFTNVKNIIIAPLTQLFHVSPEEYMKINYFMINPKKSYNSDLIRDHVCLYLNYFERFFDQEKEYYTNLSRIKFMVDCFPEYQKNNFFTDIQRYLLNDSIFNKTRAMVDANYSLSLSYKSANNPQLQYTNEHGKVLMHISLMMNLCIPIITHFAYVKHITDIDEYLLDIYDNILYSHHFNGIDIVSKLYETANSNVARNEKNNVTIWAKQDIRGKDVVTHSMAAERNIILNIIPKYTFDKNMVSLDYTSIQKSNKFQITDIAYEYSYVPLSSSRRDGEDNSSDFDRFEANLVKADESLYLQSKVNCQYNMAKIDRLFGPFDERELNYYIRNLRNDNFEVVNVFQKQLIFNLFYKYFGDTSSINNINATDYVKLMLGAKKLLINNKMSELAYILSGKVNKIISRKTLNKKEMQDMETSQYYPLVVEKYKNMKKINTLILGTIATIITSNFSIIDYQHQELTGQQIQVESRIIIEEVLLYILLI